MINNTRAYTANYDLGQREGERPPLSSGARFSYTEALTLTSAIVCR